MEKEWLNKPRKRGNPEAHLVLQCIYYLRACGYMAGKVKVKGSPKVGGGWIFDPYLMRGLPDIFAFNYKSKVMLGIECKVNSNKQTDDQETFECYFNHPPERIYLIIRSLEELQKAIGQ